MRKEFNDTGLCVPDRHFMVDITPKIEQIIHLVEQGKYFTINRPRQFGKTTTLFLLMQRLFATNAYLPLKISFEGIGADSFASQPNFIEAFRLLCQRFFEVNRLPALYAYTEQQRGMRTFEQFSQFISALCVNSEKALVLMIDEVDQSSNNQLFIDFLALLRTKYLARNEGQDVTFQAVILAGVHDVKSLKAKIRPDDERKFNSPWNIAVDFEVDLHFKAAEIATMLHAYCADRQMQMDIPAIAEKLYYYTSGYPYLVSKLCKFIDEKIVPRRAQPDWSVSDVDAAFAMIVDERYTTTLFDSLTKNLENNPELYDTVFQIVINGNTLKFTIADPVINFGYLYGILAPSEPDGQCQIHNRIYEQRIYAYLLSKTIRAQRNEINGLAGPEFFQDDRLNVALIIQRFQAFMQEHASRNDAHFLEREGRLLFLSFLRPILNGKGFEFKEPNVADERRMDIVITYRNQRYVIELKRWYGPKAHQEGLQQLSDYLDMYALREGYLLIFDFSKTKTYKQEQIVVNGKQIVAVWV